MPTEESGMSEEEYQAWSHQQAQNTLFLAGCRMVGTDQYGTTYLTLGMSDAEHGQAMKDFREANSPTGNAPMPGVTYLEDHWPK